MVAATLPHGGDRPPPPMEVADWGAVAGAHRVSGPARPKTGPVKSPPPRCCSTAATSAAFLYAPPAIPPPEGGSPARVPPQTQIGPKWAQIWASRSYRGSTTHRPPPRQPLPASPRRHHRTYEAEPSPPPCHRRRHRSAATPRPAPSRQEEHRHRPAEPKSSPGRPRSGPSARGQPLPRSRPPSPPCRKTTSAYCPWPSPPKEGPRTTPPPPYTPPPKKRRRPASRRENQAPAQRRGPRPPTAQEEEKASPLPAPTGLRLAAPTGSGEGGGGGAAAAKARVPPRHRAGATREEERGVFLSYVICYLSKGLASEIRQGEGAELEKTLTSWRPLLFQCSFPPSLYKESPVGRTLPSQSHFAGARRKHTARPGKKGERQSSCSGSTERERERASENAQRRRRRAGGRGGGAQAEEHGREQAGEGRQRQQQRRGQPARAAAARQVPRLEGHALHHRERDFREAGYAGHVGEPAGVPDAGVPHAERGRRDAPQRLQRHQQPRPHRRRLPLRRVPRPLPRARHRHRRIPHRHVLPDTHGRRGQPAPGGLRRGRRLPESHLLPVRRPLHILRLPRRRLGRDPAMQHAVRGGPVRPAHRVRQAGHQQLLQLVLLHLHLGDARVRDGHHLRAEQRELGAGPRHPHGAHVPRLRALLHGHAPLRAGHPRGEPLHDHRAGVLGGGGEAGAEAGQGPEAGPLRPAAHQQHRRQARTHGPVPVPGQGGHGGVPRRGAARRGCRGEPVAALHRAAGGGGEVPHPDRAGLVHGDHLLRRRRAAVHLRGILRAAVRPTPRRRQLPRARGFLHRLRHAGADAVDPDLRPAPRAKATEGDGKGRRVHAAPAPGHRDRALHARHGHLRLRRGPPQGHRAQPAHHRPDADRRRHLRHVQLLDGAAAHDPGARRGLQPHQPDRVLLQGDPRAHEERRRRARLLQPRARQLPQRLHHRHRAQDHRGRPELAGAGPQPGQARPLLLDHRRHRRLQLRILHHLREVVQVQGSQQLRKQMHGLNL